MFVPAIIRLVFDLKGKYERMKDKKMQKKEMPDENSGNVRQEKKSKLCSKICFGTLKTLTRFVVLIIFLIHFAVIGYNLYFRGLKWHWIGILYLYIIWSSFKYTANYLRVDNPIISPKKNFETDCIRSWIASIFQIISKINFSFISDFERLSPQSIGSFNSGFEKSRDLVGTPIRD